MSLAEIQDLFVLEWGPLWYCSQHRGPCWTPVPAFPKRNTSSRNFGSANGCPFREPFRGLLLFVFPPAPIEVFD